jgi:hypothetical protein
MEVTGCRTHELCVPNGLRILKIENFLLLTHSSQETGSVLLGNICQQGLRLAREFHVTALPVTEWQVFRWIHPYCVIIDCIDIFLQVNKEIQAYSEEPPK